LRRRHGSLPSTNPGAPGDRTPGDDELTGALLVEGAAGSNSDRRGRPGNRFPDGAAASIAMRPTINASRIAARVVTMEKLIADFSGGCIRRGAPTKSR
jgi:hypothetical protein